MIAETLPHPSTLLASTATIAEPIEFVHDNHANAAPVTAPTTAATTTTAAAATAAVADSPTPTPTPPPALAGTPPAQRGATESGKEFAGELEYGGRLWRQGSIWQTTKGRLVLAGFRLEPRTLSLPRRTRILCLSRFALSPPSLSLSRPPLSLLLPTPSL